MSLPTPAQSVVPSPEQQVSQSLLAASLLALCGGGLDAFVYLNHHHVFAASMTGNGVFLGIAALSRDRHEFLRHLLPMITFFCGVWSAEAVGSRFKRRAATIGLLCELITLLGASFLPLSFPDVLFIPLISFASAFQIASFRTVNTYAYNSTFITGNLRTAVAGLYATLNPLTREAGLHQFLNLGSIITSFIFGAMFGATLAPRFANHTLWFLMLPLLIVLMLVNLSHRRASAASR
ncbi:MAG: YoaK family protein [Acidobacteriaceae bacterium]|nr:YoaK family protein [Acidobacteriaceae bacterium]